MENSKGFTFLEIIIVVVIIGVLSLAGRAVYLDFNVRKSVEVETNIVVSYLDLARTKTLANEVACETFEGFYSTQIVTADGVSTLSLVPEGCDPVTEHVFPEGYSFPEGDFEINYERFGTGVNGTQCLIIQHPRAPVCGLITIEQSGSIEEEVVPEAQCNC